MKTLEKNGHSIGLHSLNHVDAPVYFNTYGAEKYIEKEVLPQLEICRKEGLAIKSFAYPNNRRNDDTDKPAARRCAKKRGGNCGR